MGTLLIETLFHILTYFLYLGYLPQSNPSLVTKSGGEKRVGWGERRTGVVRNIQGIERRVFNRKQKLHSLTDVPVVSSVGSVGLRGGMMVGGNRGCCSFSNAKEAESSKNFFFLQILIAQLLPAGAVLKNSL